jgi:hypothetical protein
VRGIENGTWRETANREEKESETVRGIESRERIGSETLRGIGSHVKNGTLRIGATGVLMTVEKTAATEGPRNDVTGDQKNVAIEFRMSVVHHHQKSVASEALMSVVSVYPKTHVVGDQKSACRLLLLLPLLPMLPLLNQIENLASADMTTRSASVGHGSFLPKIVVMSGHVTTWTEMLREKPTAGKNHQRRKHPWIQMRNTDDVSSKKPREADGFVILAMEIASRNDAGAGKRRRGLVIVATILALGGPILQLQSLLIPVTMIVQSRCWMRTWYKSPTQWTGRNPARHSK